MTSAPNQSAKFPILLNERNKSAYAHTRSTKRGREDGHDLDDWLRAEAGIMGTNIEAAAA